MNRECKINKVRVFLIMAVTAITFSACVTTYYPQQDGFSGGYSDTPLGGTRYRVDVVGTPDTSRQRVMDVALVHAAHIAVSSGYDYFKIVSTDIDSFETIMGWTDAVADAVSYTIEMTHDETDLHAQEILKTIGPSVGYQQYINSLSANE
jgi:hypothetical protein